MADMHMYIGMHVVIKYDANALNGNPINRYLLTESITTDWVEIRHLAFIEVQGNFDFRR